MSRTSVTVAFALTAALTGSLVGACSKKHDAPAATQDPGEPPRPEPNGGTPPPAMDEKRPSEYPQPRLPAMALADDAKRQEKIELGHALFFDKRLSGDGSRACYSCHQNEQGSGGKDQIGRAHV